MKTEQKKTKKQTKHLIFPCFQSCLTLVIDKGDYEYAGLEREEPIIY